MSGAQKTVSAGSPPYSVLVNRRIGRYIAAATYRLGATPNQVTGASALLTFAGIILVATFQPSWWLGLAVWTLLAIGYAFDSADGQLARIRGGGSIAGEWLDHVVDSTKIVSIHLAVLIMLFRHANLSNQAFLLVPIGYTIVATVAFFSMILNDQLKNVSLLKSGRQSFRRKRSILKSIILIPTDYGVLCLIFIALGNISIFFIIYTLFFIANTCYLLLALRFWFSDMKRLSNQHSASDTE
ncbi:CDP-alcohol phosphatidyltransferase family protein [Arthrobacter alpinus]|uniref:CDP-alcohol phosphatidyltransferase family protein n=1 Tax=Arthrobacter alpinus TaxID=656366 RepID=UPI0021BD34A8|nr:CDP-alcohol phosphatidyltransferase family protein [Arthrobacter alpinus]